METEAESSTRARVMGFYTILGSAQGARVMGFYIILHMRVRFSDSGQWSSALKEPVVNGIGVGSCSSAACRTEGCL
jgi:hypothetical protein